MSTRVRSSSSFSICHPDKYQTIMDRRNYEIPYRDLPVLLSSYQLFELTVMDINKI